VRSAGARWLFGTRSIAGRAGFAAGRATESFGRRPAAGMILSLVGSKTGRSITLVASSLSSSDESRGSGSAFGGGRGAVGACVVSGRMSGGFAPPIGRS
jgi:hypothetical protein